MAAAYYDEVGFERGGGNRAILLPGETVTVYQDAPPGTQSASLQSLFSNELLTVPLANPFTADSLGNLVFWADATWVWVKVGTRAARRVRISQVGPTGLTGAPGTAAAAASTLAGLPAATAGEIRRVTNDVRGLWFADGLQWLALSGRVVDVREFGAIGDGAAHPLSDRFGSLGAAQAVYPFVTALTQQLDYAGIQAAILQVETGNVGGKVWLGRGTFVVNSELEIDEWGTHIWGVSFQSTQLLWQTDLGSAKYGIKAVDSGGQGNASGLHYLRTTGPGSFGYPLTGTQACDMDGIRLNSMLTLDHVYTNQFRAGWVMCQDHHFLNRSMSNGNFYNVLYPTGTTKGNDTFIACLLQGAGFASVAVEGGNDIDFALFYQCDLGASPYGIYKFDGGAASVIGMISNSHFVNCTFEGIGNACLRDASTGGGSGSDSIFRSCFQSVGHSWGGANYRLEAQLDTDGIADNDAGGKGNWPVDVRVVNESRFKGPGFDPGAKGYFRCVGQSGSHMDIHTFGSSGAAVLVANAFKNVGNLILHQATMVARIRVASGALTKGMYTSESGSYDTAAKFGTIAGYTPSGIALHDATDGQTVAIAFEGEVSALARAIPHWGIHLQPEAATGYLTPVNHAGAFGLSGTADASPLPTPIAAASLGPGSEGLQVVRLLGPFFDRQFVAPGAVSVLPTASATYRGQMLTVEGGGGAADVVYVCQKAAGGTYSWKTLSTG